jgi:hypothetical protein
MKDLSHYFQTFDDARPRPVEILIAERLGEAQAALAEARAGQLRGELVEAAEVEPLWTRKLRAFGNRVLAIPARVRDLSARQNVSLTQEPRVLTEVAEDN